MAMMNHEISSVFSHVITKFATATPTWKSPTSPWRFPKIFDGLIQFVFVLFFSENNTPSSTRDHCVSFRFRVHDHGPYTKNLQLN
jgi:hypothetical protein